MTVGELACLRGWLGGFFCWNRWPARPPFWDPPGPTPLWSREEHVDLLQPRRVWLVSWLGSWLDFLLRWHLDKARGRIVALAHPADTILPVIFLIYTITVTAASAAWKFRPEEACSGQVNCMQICTMTQCQEQKSHLTIHGSGNAYNSRQRQGSISFAWHTAKA